jgi:hypothetical protein
MNDVVLSDSALIVDELVELNQRVGTIEACLLFSIGCISAILVVYILYTALMRFMQKF